MTVMQDNVHGQAVWHMDWWGLTVSICRKTQVIDLEQVFKLNKGAIVINFPSSYKCHMLQVAMCNLQRQT